MSLYNLVCGTYPFADLLLGVLELPLASIPRFRDCYLNLDHIELLTRTGGGNREAYAEQNEGLTRHPLYLSDRDDEFDSTFAIFCFSFPAEHRSDLQLLGQKLGPASSLKERFEIGMEQLSGEKLAYFRGLFDSLRKHFDEPKS